MKDAKIIKIQIPIKNIERNRLIKNVDESTWQKLKSISKTHNLSLAKTIKKIVDEFLQKIA